MSRGLAYALGALLDSLGGGDEVRDSFVHSRAVSRAERDDTVDQGGEARRILCFFGVDRHCADAVGQRSIIMFSLDHIENE